ncbi:MAG: PAS domain S-box protein [Thermodesulfobacteriota bacterium]
MLAKAIEKIHGIMLRGSKYFTKHQQDELLTPSLLKELVNEISDAIFIIDPETSRFLYVNNKACKNLGYSRKELLKMGVVDIEAELPDDFSWHEHVKILCERKDNFFLGRHKCKDGTELPVEVHVKYTSLEKGEFILSVARDLSESKDFEEKVIQEKNKLEAVVAALGDGLTVLDREFTILYQNEIHKRLVGGHIGKHCYNGIHGKDTVCEGCLLTKCYEDGQAHRRETMRKKDGNVKYFEISASPLKNSQGLIFGGIETVRDITDRKQLEMQLQESQKMEAIGTLAGGIAHDFNNILTAIIGNSELAKLSIKAERDPTNYVDLVLDAGARATELVKQILAFSHKKEIELQIFEPHLIVMEALKMLRSSIPSTVDFQENIDNECGLIEADPTKIHQIVINLCTNALHSIENEKGALSISLSREEITAAQVSGKDVSPGPFIVLSVSDTGHGMNNEMIERIFDPYFTTKEEGRGTGLGLAIVHRAIKDYRGFISVESEPEKGTNFKVYLPAVTKDLALSGNGEKEKNLPRGNERILVVDDEKTIADMLEAFLEGLGYTVTAIMNSSDALEKIRAKPDQFDLLITDQTMPRLSGFEMAQAALQITSDLPIILFTGHSSVVSETDALEIGIKKYAFKPIKLNQLAKTVRGLLDDDCRQ